MQITSGKIPTAKKILIYGPEGIGKSTFAARFPQPLFIDTENSTIHMDVSRLPKPEAWLELINEVNWVLANPDCCRTLVLDTADWAETLCNEYVCARDKKTGIEDYGYGKGYVFAQEEFGRLPNLLEQVIAKGIHVVVCCHAQMRKFEQPDEMGAYDRWELKLSKKIAPMLREWSDAVLFANYKTIVVNVDGQGTQKGKNKAQGGMRVMYTTHHPCWDAKNRFGLPDELPFSYDSIRPVIEGDAAQKPSPLGKVPPKGADEVPASAAAQAGANLGAALNSALARAVEAAASPSLPPEGKGSAKPTDEATSSTLAPAAEPGADFTGIPTPLVRLMTEAGVNPDEIRYVIAQKGYYPAGTPWPVIVQNEGFLKGWLLHPDVWPQVVKAVMANRDKAPF